MKNYKDYEKKIIGASNIATLVAVGCCGNGLNTGMIQFGSDGVYSAYIVDQDAEIGEHYKKVYSFTDWLKIYDDEGLAFDVCGKEINIYRAAEMGCIIQVIK